MSCSPRSMRWRIQGHGRRAHGTGIAAIDLSTKTNQTPFSQVFGGRKRNTVTLDGPIGLLPHDEAVRKPKHSLIKACAPSR